MVSTALTYLSKHDLEPAEVESLRVIRNSCREYLTHNTSEISPEIQQWWWEHVKHDFDVQPYLFFRRHIANPVGYGLIRRLNGKQWLSGGLVPEYRGFGLGRILFGYLVELAGGPCWLDVLLSNKMAIRTYERLGFKVDSHDDRVQTMVKQ